MANPPVGDPFTLQDMHSAIRQIPGMLADRNRELLEVLRDIAGYLAPLRIGVQRTATTTGGANVGAMNVFTSADTYQSPQTTRQVDLTAFDRNMLWQYQDFDGQWSDAFELPSGVLTSWPLACVGIRVRSSDTTGVAQTRYQVTLWT